MHFLSDVLLFGQTYDSTFRYGRRRVSTALPSAAGVPSVPAGNLICQTRMKSKLPLGKRPLLRKPLRQPPVLRPLPAVSDTAQAVPGAEAAAGARIAGRGSEGHPAASPQTPPPAGTRMADRAQPGATLPSRECGAGSSSFPSHPNRPLPCAGSPALTTRRLPDCAPSPAEGPGRAGPGGALTSVNGSIAVPVPARGPLAEASRKRPHLHPNRCRDLNFSARRAQAPREQGAAPARGRWLTGAPPNRAAARPPARGNWGPGLGGHRCSLLLSPRVLRVTLTAALLPRTSLCGVLGVRPAVAALSQNLFGKCLWDQGVPTYRGITLPTRPWHWVPRPVLNTSRDGDSAASPDCAFQWLITPSVRKFIQISNLNLPWHGLKAMSSCPHLPAPPGWQPLFELRGFYLLYRRVIAPGRSHILLQLLSRSVPGPLFHWKINFSPGIDMEMSAENIIFVWHSKCRGCLPQCNCAIVHPFHDENSHHFLHQSPAPFHWHTFLSEYEIHWDPLVAEVHSLLSMHHPNHPSHTFFQHNHKYSLFFPYLPFPFWGCYVCLPKWMSLVCPIILAPL